MTFLMHAASGSTDRSADAAHSAVVLRRRRGALSQQTPIVDSVDPSTSGYIRARDRLPLDRFHGISEEEYDVKDRGPGPRGKRSLASINDRDHSAVPGGAPSGFSERFGSSAPQIHPSASPATKGDEMSEFAPDSTQRCKGLMDPSLVVFKTAWTMVEKVLWKNQVCFSTRSGEGGRPGATVRACLISNFGLTTSDLGSVSTEEIRNIRGMPFLTCLVPLKFAQAFTWDGPSA